MTQEDKELLLKYLCMALPYGVICNVVKSDNPFIGNCKLNIFWLDKVTSVFYNIKPYLRPMSSMTESERFELEQIIGYDTEIRDDFLSLLSPSIKRLSYVELLAVFEWLNKRHFDYYGLIPKGLAIAVTKDNNPYKE